ncbi:MAG: DUF262 domain-containing protein [bacterium]|nr:DUF262 domain-containing protein [bacterium]
MKYTSTVQTISWFRDRYREGSLTIKPPYQRKLVWKDRQKCYLIESILMGLPVPEVYIQQTISVDGSAHFAVVDGQQRIRSILQFIGAESDPDELDSNKFALDKLQPDSHWRSVTFAQLSDDEKRNFYGYSLAVRYLNTDIDNEVRDMFTRLNKYLSPLKPQELRNATYSGPFVDLVLSFAEEEYWSENRIVSPALIRRMGDVEFLSELLIGVMHGPQGGGAKLIDGYYAQYEDFEEEFPDQPEAKRLFNRTLATVQDVLPNIKETRWRNKTDFYTLFVALASLLRSNMLTQRKLPALRSTLEGFAEEVNLRLSDDNATVSQAVIQYVRAVEKGPNEKTRRANRHVVVVDLVQRYFRPNKRASR